MLQLNDPSLLRTQCLIDGAWARADDGCTLAVSNPANGEIIATVPTTGDAETRHAIATAGAPFGRVKRSGVGREGSRYGIEGCIDTKYPCMVGL